MIIPRNLLNNLKDKTELNSAFLDHWSEIENDFFLNSLSNDFPQRFRIRVMNQNCQSCQLLKNSNLYSRTYCWRLKIIYDSTTVQLYYKVLIAFSSFKLRKGFKVRKIKISKILGKVVKRTTFSFLDFHQLTVLSTVSLAWAAFIVNVVFDWHWRFKHRLADISRFYVNTNQNKMHIWIFDVWLMSWYEVSGTFYKNMKYFCPVHFLHSFPST